MSEIRDVVEKGAADYLGAVPHLVAGLTAYVLDHRKTGGFLQACLENDFTAAALRADHQSAPAFQAIGLFLHHSTPRECHGSKEKVAAWLSGEVVASSAPLIEEVANVAIVAEGATPDALPPPTTRGNLPPDTEDVEGPMHPGGTEEDA